MDEVAFGAKWAIDIYGITESCTATPQHRARTVDFGARRMLGGSNNLDNNVGNGADLDAIEGVVGYAISGRAGPEGYLQRLAVHPNVQGNGIGSALVFDALNWMRRSRATRAVVNTHDDNLDALRLYRRIGFRALPHGLLVAERGLDDL